MAAKAESSKLGSAEYTTLTISKENRAQCGERHLQELRVQLESIPGCSDIMKKRKTRPKNWQYVERERDDAESMFGSDLSENEEDHERVHAEEAPARAHARDDPTPPEAPEFYIARMQQAAADRVPLTEAQVALMKEFREDRSYFEERIKVLKEDRAKYDKISKAGAEVIRRSVSMDIMTEFKSAELEDFGLMWPALARILSDITETEAQSVLHSYDMLVQGKNQSITALNEEFEFMEKALSKTK